MMFMASKDDNLLLQMGSLFNSVIGAKCLATNLKQSVPELFGQYQPPTDELDKGEDEMPHGMKMIESKTDLMNVFFDILVTDMPFRNFTLRFYSKMLLEMEPQFKLNKNQKQQLLLAFLESNSILKKTQNQILGNERLRTNPELRFYDTLIEEINEFREPEACLKGEFTRLIAHPALLLRLIPEKFNQKMPM